MKNSATIANDKRKRLVDVLIKSTSEGKLKWQATIDENSFKVDFRKSGVKISEDGSDYTISVVNDSGDVVDLFTDNELDGRSTLGSFDVDVDAGYDYYNKLKDLFFNAKRVSLGSDEVLDAILSELENPTR